MTRFIDDALLFLLPFIAFCLYLLARRRNPLLWTSWNKEVSWLVIAGLACVIVSLLATFAFSERQRGAFVPAHMENGRLVPGQFR
jgi:Family of unknown function (DUF6111)